MSTIGEAVDQAIGDILAASRPAVQAVADVAVTQAQADVKAQLDGALATAARLQANLDTVTGQLASTQAQATQLQADLAAANARIAELEGEDPPPDYAPVYGISVNDTKAETPLVPGDVARIEKWTSADAVQAIRVFYTGLPPTDWASDPALTNSYANGVRIFHLSTHATVTDAWATALAATVPADVEILMTEHHEPEDDGVSRSSWVASQTAASQKVRAVGFRFVLTLMGWTFNPNSGRNPEDWWVDGVYDGATADVYNKDMDVVLPKVKAFADGHGVPWGVSETGASTTVKGKPQSQAERVQWAKDARAAVAANEPTLPVLWWDVKSSSGFDNTLNDELADAFFGIV